jgi:hypothetical protein
MVIMPYILRDSFGDIIFCGCEEFRTMDVAYEILDINENATHFDGYDL